MLGSTGLLTILVKSTIAGYILQGYEALLSLRTDSLDECSSPDGFQPLVIQLVSRPENKYTST